jgi:putative spermidine/putrescine transport system permease protein
MRRHRGALARLRLRVAVVALWMLRIGAFALLFVPIALVIGMSFGGDAYATFPPRSWSFKWYLNVFRRDEFVSSFLTSLTVAALVTPISVTIGTLAAYGLWRRPGRTARALESVFMSPVLLPLVVTGLAVLVFVNRVGHRHRHSRRSSARMSAITFPYAFRAVLAALGRYDRRLDEAAASLKVRPLQAFRHVTLPLIRPGHRRRRDVRLRHVVRRLRGDDLPDRPRHADAADRDLPVHGVQPRSDRLRGLVAAGRDGDRGGAGGRARDRRRPLLRHRRFDALIPLDRPTHWYTIKVYTDSSRAFRP